LTDFTPRQLKEIILRSLHEAARDVDEHRVPLDGRVRILPDVAAKTDKHATVYAAE
jgi:hypothetical protein